MDGRVNTDSERPDVIEQMEGYTEVIGEQEKDIIREYAKHIDTINKLFGTDFKPPRSLITTAKLIIYETPTVNGEPRLTKNGKNPIKTIVDKLGANNVAWFKIKEEPTIGEIWGRLCK